MARPRTPTAKADVSGAAAKNPQRHRDRKSPGGVAQLGAPRAGMLPFEKKAFLAFKAELPWLKESHRLLVEIASTYRGQILDPEAHPSLATLQELRRCLAQLGATPADESKVNAPNGEEDDPDAAFFQPAGQGRPN